MVINHLLTGIIPLSMGNMLLHPTVDSPIFVRKALDLAESTGMSSVQAAATYHDMAGWLDHGGELATNPTAQNRTWGGTLWVTPGDEVIVYNLETRMKLEYTYY